MARVKKYTGQLVFGLDIGTRSIVGTVGYKEGDRFIVVAQRVKEHETRAMLDGQIHDIHKVGETIAAVKKELEDAIGRKLTEVCIAAAGRVLRTVTTHAQLPYSHEKEIEPEDVYALVAYGVEQAYEEFLEEEKEEEIKFYCVGHSVVRYYLNGYPIGNLEGHKARNIGVDLIATFLPEDVVDGLYKAVELAGLTVGNLTLEPIAAIQVAIPERFRMLNIALIDVGAGTSDISITNDGCILAYGMIPMAGDAITEAVARHCLVDFAVAERIKREAGTLEEVTFEDIMFLPQTMKSEDVLEVTRPVVQDMVEQIADKIKELNGGKSVSAVFVVGGGGKIPGYTQALAEELGIAKERVALRGEEVMQQIVFEEDVKKDSLLVTPVGICLNFYEQSNNFIFVSFNDQKVKIYDNNKLTVADAAMQAGFPNDGLFPKRGTPLNFTVNGKGRIIRGELGEAAVIMVNGKLADIHTPIHANDIIKVERSTAGNPATLTIGDLPEVSESISFMVNDQKVEMPKFASVNGNLQSAYYEIKENDKIEMLSFYTVKQLTEFMDVILDANMNIYVNNKLADYDTPVYENFSVIFTLEKLKFDTDAQEKEAQTWEELAEDDGVRAVRPEEEKKEASSEENHGDEAQQDAAKKTVDDADKGLAQSKDGQADESEEIPVTPAVPHDIMVLVNGKVVRLSGKANYVFVDVFEWIDFDLTKPKGKAIVTKLNGRQAQYMEPIYDNSVIEIYWEE